MAETSLCFFFLAASFLAPLSCLFTWSCSSEKKAWEDRSALSFPSSWWKQKRVRNAKTHDSSLTKPWQLATSWEQYWRICTRNLNAIRTQFNTWTQFNSQHDWVYAYSALDSPWIMFSDFCSQIKLAVKQCRWQQFILGIVKDQSLCFYSET